MIEKYPRNPVLSLRLSSSTWMRALGLQNNSEVLLYTPLGIYCILPWVYIVYSPGYILYTRLGIYCILAWVASEPSPKQHSFLTAPALSLHPLPSTINNYLNLPFGSHGRSRKPISYNQEMGHRKDLTHKFHRVLLGIMCSGMPPEAAAGSHSPSRLPLSAAAPSPPAQRPAPPGGAPGWQPSWRGPRAASRSPSVYLHAQRSAAERRHRLFFPTSLRKYSTLAGARQEYKGEKEISSGICDCGIPIISCILGR